MRLEYPKQDASQEECMHHGIHNVRSDRSHLCDAEVQRSYHEVNDESDENRLAIRREANKIPIDRIA